MGKGGNSGEAVGDESAQFLPADERVSWPLAGSADAFPASAPGGAAPPWLVRMWRAVLRFFQVETAKDAARGAGFLCLPVLLAAGAATYFALPFEPGALPLTLYCAFFAIAACVTRQRPFAMALSTALLVFALGLAVAKLETWRADTPMVGSDVTTNITGRLVRLEHQASGRIRLTVDIQTTERPQLHYPPERVRLSARSVPDGLQPGDGISGLVRLMSPSGPVRPGTYDFSFASYFAGRGAVGFFMSGPDIAALEEDLPVWAYPARWLERKREALAERIRTHVDGSEGEIAVAIITGFRKGIPEEVNEWLRRAGMAHILAISGLHMALVAATMMVIVRTSAAAFPGLASRHPVKKYAAVAALAMCTLYLFISGAAVAAQRSYIMLGIMLAALLFDRAALTMRNVAIAALIIIALSPHEVIGPSFQMSFAATAALVASYAAWTDWRRERVVRSDFTQRSLLRRVLRTLLLFFAGVAATSIIAGLATTLYGVWHFQRVSPLALGANLLAMPLVSLIAMPSAVIAMLALPFGLDGVFLAIMGRVLAAVIAVAKWFSDNSPVDSVGLIPLLAMLMLTSALVILVVSTTRLRLLALPFAAAGLVLLMTRDLPDVLVTEDARLVGILDGSGILAVNRTRPNGFTMSDWERALAAETVVKPDNKEARPAANSIDGSDFRFSCGEGLCLTRLESGALIAHAENEEAARTVCATAALLVLDDATTENPCPGIPVTVLTKRDLARNGSAAIHFQREGSTLAVEIVFATPEPWRPWHDHRAWSRSARGLASD
ncbi:ComEC/Rec2 family competence protein [Chelativorans sp. YIM 93263]|uniref:ComEC/Rec2 family competence protein n=1 Tax=Chelativorans sp. YIM 93263 TaxID=2906648 RepID=UPI002378A864|nr:ComEC/Rec2 family competence protein [Chelativorans sp. YIM 93263]